MAEDTSYHGCAGLGILMILIIIACVACFNRFNKTRDAELLNVPPTSTAVPAGISETAMPEPATMPVPVVADADVTNIDPGPLKAYVSANFSIEYPIDARVGSPSVLTDNQVVRISNLSSERRNDSADLGEREFYLELRMNEGGDDCRKYMLDSQITTVNEISVYRGNVEPGTYQGYRSALCFNRAGIYYRFDLTEGSPQRFIAKAVFNSLRIEK